MVPHLVRWDKTYRSRGLVVLDVDNGAIDRKNAIAEHIAKKQITYPVLWDENQATCRRYRVNAYPTALLIGVDGKILWRGNPSPAQVEMLQAKIEKALEEVDRAGLVAAGSPFLREAGSARTE